MNLTTRGNEERYDYDCVTSSRIQYARKKNDVTLVINVVREIKDFECVARKDLGK